MVKIKVSTKWLSKNFKCDEEFIRTTCKGRCCQGSNKILISLLPTETETIQEHYPTCEIKDDKIVGKKCFFKDECELCKLHGTPYKPLGCIFSPFKINKNNTLVVRHRYIMFPCFNSEGGEPVYITFREGLIKVFGPDTYSYIKKKMEEKSGDFYIEINDDMLDKLKFLEEVKHG